ncbi:hypothetical protein SAMN05216554_2628 [Herbiconiux ginsengi]|uniref:Uncharacterized protein n=2 Tax=Herbiconiux ginsengi TaxID=381665 RepID=A0A1H3QM45_9MICO|nr:hypothetical protein SAMN05216554_2628 [Herbiconiux ginsengi]
MKRAAIGAGEGYPESMTDFRNAAGRDPETGLGSGEEVDSFDRELEDKIHKYIAAATPTDGPAPAG